MTPNEAEDLLTYISVGFDNRAISKSAAAIWADLMPDVDVKDAMAAVKAHFLSPAPRRYLDVAAILDGVRVITRQTPEAIEADVRSAKARGLIDGSWPRSTPLPPDVARRLALARHAEIAERAEIEARYAALEPGPPIEPGEIGRDVPRA
jgi:hypothetical protein